MGTTNASESKTPQVLEGIWIQGYGLIPKAVTTDSTILPYPKLVLAYMLSFTGAGNDQCWPTVSKMARDLGIAERTVVSAIKFLVDRGLVSKTKKFTGDRLKRNNVYKLLLLTHHSAPGAPSTATTCTLDSYHVPANINIGIVTNDKKDTSTFLATSTKPMEDKKDGLSGNKVESGEATEHPDITLPVEGISTIEGCAAPGIEDRSHLAKARSRIWNISIYELASTDDGHGFNGKYKHDDARNLIDYVEGETRKKFVEYPGYDHLAACIRLINHYKGPIPAGRMLRTWASRQPGKEIFIRDYIRTIEDKYEINCIDVDTEKPEPKVMEPEVQTESIIVPGNNYIPASDNGGY